MLSAAAQPRLDALILFLYVTQMNMAVITALLLLYYWRQLQFATLDHTVLCSFTGMARPLQSQDLSATNKI